VVAAANVDLISGAEVRSVEAGGAGATARLATGEELKCALLVAADSRFSATRREMGIPAAMRDFGRTVIVCRMGHEKPHHGIAYECFHYGQTLAVLPLAGKHASVVITLPSNRLEQVLQMDEGSFNRDLERRFNSRLGAMTLLGERYPYPLVAVHADRFVGRRFALIGDAAVGMHPVTAHGFNLGLLGADTLSDEIGKALAGNRDIFSARVLQRYQARHRRVTRPIYHATNAIVRLYTRDDLPARVMRRAVLGLGGHVPLMKRLVVRQLTNTEVAPG
jgi:ubiquinone biosynthesis UbiH/UbiF/VisC/COQ6 family hydroxylase